jgi:hypothetical protein
MQHQPSGHYDGVLARKVAPPASDECDLLHGLQQQRCILGYAVHKLGRINGDGRAGIVFVPVADATKPRVLAYRAGNGVRLLPKAVTGACRFARERRQ